MPLASPPPPRPRRRTRRPHRRGLHAFAVALALAVGAAHAQEEEASEAPVLLSADAMTVDEELGIVTATGNVELARGPRILLADVVTYNQRTDVVTATGNVRLLEPTGEVVFADYVELTEDLRQGFVENVRVLLTDDSRFAAAEGERRAGRVTRLNRGVYSPCELCPEDPSRPPLWQIKAVRIVHDRERREIEYRDATLEIAGIPVAYTPYFTHPDPTVDRRSGFLFPSFGGSSDIGLFASVPYYFDIAPDKDATVELGWSEEDGPFLGAEWRQRFENGRLELDGSLVRADRREAGGIREDRLRGHLFARGAFDLDETWRWGFDYNRASDDTYLLRYDISDADVLQSTAFVEGFEGRNYATARAYAFQDLRPGGTEDEPLILPLAQVSALGEPGETLGGRWSLDAGLLGIYRSESDETQRVATRLGWERDIVAGAGFVTTLSASVRGDVYNVTDIDEGVDEIDSDASVRLFPQAQMTVRYPFARTVGTVQQFVEPIAALTLAPNVGDDPDIPNEDSLALEFDDTNLFRPSRFPGIDRLEGGSRIAYGLRTGVYGFGGGAATFFLGQSYRFSETDDFPVGSGLEDQFSDYVGRLDVSPGPWADLLYAFRLDKDDLAPRRHDVALSAGPAWLRGSVRYIFIDDQAGTETGENREELLLAASTRLSDHWSAGLSHRRDLTDDGGSLTTGLTFVYEDECLIFQVTGQRDYTERTDIASGDTVFFRVVFKNLGEVESPRISLDDLRGGAEPTEPDADPFDTPLEED